MSLEIQGVVIRGLRGGTQKNRTKADGEVVHVHLVLLAVGRDFLQMVQHQSHGFLRDKIQVFFSPLVTIPGLQVLTGR